MTFFKKNIWVSQYDNAFVSISGTPSLEILCIILVT